MGLITGGVYFTLSVGGKNKYKKYQNKYVTFGRYEQDGDLSNGEEPIEWKVLDVNEDSALLISKYVLVYKPYEETGGPITWENCTLRRWMNDEFYDEAFSDKDKNFITDYPAINDDNYYSGADGGADTRDKVFCLSLSEIIKYYNSGRWPDNDEYVCKSGLLGKPTAYAKTKWYEDHDGEYNAPGVVITGTPDLFSDKYASWWLRTAGSFNDMTCGITWEGGVGAQWFDNSVGLNYIGVRPCICIILGRENSAVRLITE